MDRKPGVTVITDKLDLADEYILKDKIHLNRNLSVNR